MLLRDADVVHQAFTIMDLCDQLHRAADFYVDCAHVGPNPITEQCPPPPRTQAEALVCVCASLYETKPQIYPRNGVNPNRLCVVQLYPPPLPLTSLSLIFQDV